MIGNQFSQKYAQEFRAYYARAMTWSALGFGASHAMQALIIGFAANKSIGINPTVFAVLVPYELFQSMIFFPGGWVLAYVPSTLLYDLIKSVRRNSALLYICSGVFIGVIFVPLCASVPYFLLKLPDEPDYLTRCAEFSLPMIMAGATGGFAFWRRSHGSPQKSEGAADQFS